MRGAGIVLALGSALIVLGAITVTLAAIFNGHHVAWNLRLASVLMGAAMTVIFGLLVKIGFHMFRRVDAVAVQNFSFIFAVFTARALYEIAPRGWLRKLAEHFAAGSPFLAPRHGGSGLLALAAFLSFFFFRRLYASALMNILGLNPPKPTADGDDSSIPEFPAKSPLIELP
jgi:hypothetical protein